MRYEWDGAKNRENRRKHGIGFEAMDGFDWAFALLDELQDHDGEERDRHIGPIGDRLYVVVVTLRMNGTRVISLRPAENLEIALWREEMHGRETQPPRHP